jgi:hypothetical protein
MAFQKIVRRSHHTKYSKLFENVIENQSLHFFGFAIHLITGLEVCFPNTLKEKPFVFWISNHSITELTSYQGSFLKKSRWRMNRNSKPK